MSDEPLLARDIYSMYKRVCPACLGTNTTWLASVVTEFGRACRDCDLTYDPKFPITQDQVPELLKRFPFRKFWVDGKIVERIIKGGEECEAELQAMELTTELPSPAEAGTPD